MFLRVQRYLFAFIGDQKIKAKGTHVFLGLQQSPFIRDTKYTEITIHICKEHLYNFTNILLMLLFSFLLMFATYIIFNLWYP